MDTATSHHLQCWPLGWLTSGDQWRVGMTAQVGAHLGSEASRGVRGDRDKATKGGQTTLVCFVVV